MRLLIANWKMNCNYKEAGELARFYCTHLKKSENVKLVVCPPVIWLESLRKIFKNSQIELGVQNIHNLEHGAVTGEISVLMVKKFAKYVICGHSERRKFFHESNELINQKVKIALKHNLVPILCVGEDKKDDGEGLIFSQLSKGVTGLLKDDIKKIVIAYEPVWAISTSENSQVTTAGYSAKVIDAIRDRLSVIYGREISERIKILYGGSVHSKNIESFLSEKTIKGFLVGSASLDQKVFENIYNSLI